MRVVPFHRPLFGEEEIAAVTAALRSGWWTSGPRVLEFERRCADRLGGGEALAVASGTDALELMLRAQGIGPGDEVITVALTFVATVEVILRVGARAVLVDVEEASGCIDPDAVAAAIGPRTRAILAVHLGGRPCRMRDLEALARARGLLLLDDAAHAFETVSDLGKVGAVGDGSAFSFYANKNLACGEGGLLRLADPEARARARLMRLHGMDRDAHARGDGRGYRGYDIVMPGMKANMADLVAALGLAQLDRLDAMTERRRAIVARYDQALAGLEQLEPPDRPATGHAWHLYAPRVRAGGADDRDALIDALARRGIGCSVHYRPLHLMTGLAPRLDRPVGSLPRSESIGARSFSLPLHPALADDEVEQVVEALEAALRERRR
ncbi:MAG: DegT/DnrJ/EryC1/StrS family aminotransferase [Planctomycetes bacterium]|nr:DegT/DnrJ/EryC1/StrS family aminotransferase [Planctomycetota bacterium]